MSDESSGTNRSNRSRKPRPKPKVRSDCGKENGSSRRFCGECGASLGGEGGNSRMKPIDEDSVLRDDGDARVRKDGACGSKGPGVSSSAIAMTE